MPLREPLVPSTALAAQVCVEAGVGVQVLAVAARHWFEEGLATLGGDLRQGLLARAAPPGEVPGEARWRGELGDVWAEMSVTPGAADDTSADYVAYTGESWSDLLRDLDQVPRGAHLAVYRLDSLRPGRLSPGLPRLDIAARYVDFPYDTWYGLKISVSMSLMGSEQQRAMLALIRSVADLYGPAYGEISFDQGSFYSSYEHNLGLLPSTNLSTSRTVLRGYSWLTVIGQEIGDRLGGLSALRGSGAFVEVAQLANGGYWLLATEDFADYGLPEATRVWQVLAPALPAVRPRPDSPYFPPHLLALEPGGGGYGGGVNSDDRHGVGDPALPSAPAPPGSVSDEVTKGNRTAQMTAIALRMSALRSRFPDALIDGDFSGQRGQVHLVCWGGEPGVVWVWVCDFRPGAGKARAEALERKLGTYLDQVRQDPLSGGMDVLAGPSLESLGLPAAEVVSNGTDPREEVTVYDAPHAGVQHYRLRRLDATSPDIARNKKVFKAAVWDAAELRHQVTEARSAAAGQPS